MEDVGKGAFVRTGISGFEIDTANPNLSVLDGVLFNKDQTVLVAYPGGAEAANYTVPDTVTSIEGNAFEDNSNLR